MKLTALAAAAALLVASSTAAMAQTSEQLKNDHLTPGDVLTYGMGYAQTRYSPLDKINKDTVKRLVPVWNYSLADTRGQESFPLVHEGVMYVTTHDATMALDARTGKQIWKSAIAYPPETPRVACCGIVNRGAAIFDGMLYRTTLDAHVIALDMKTGKELWRSHSIDFTTGYSMTVAPLVADGVVITGISGGEYGIRGFLEGWDAKTGEKLWRTYTIPGPGEPGSETWPKNDAYKNGGAPTWLTGTYDPELNTVYWGTGNAGPWNAAVRPGDNLYTCTILAINPKNGEIKWHYQTTPNDPFDYDATNELVLTEIENRKVVMQANRNGFFYVLDRTNGELVAANHFIDRVDWADSVDLETGRPNENPIAAATRAGEKVELWPSAFGGKNWSPMAYDPKRQLAFANTLSFGMHYKAVEPKYRAGTFFFGVEFGWAWPEEGETRGGLRAIDPLTGDIKWEQTVRVPRFAGVLATGGGVVFTGQQTGEFEAFDSDTGDKLWQFQMGSGIVGQPMTWEMDGKQYLSLVSGSGAVYALFSGDEKLASVPPGGSVWTFALMDQ